MTERLPVHRTGTWTFHLHLADTLQFHITSEQGERGQIRIDGHDISALLDYLYEHREVIYEATHDEERRRLEALEALAGLPAAQQQSLHVEPIRYVDEVP